MVRRSAGLIGNASTSRATSSALGAGGSATSTHSMTASGRPKAEKRAIFIGVELVCSARRGDDARRANVDRQLFGPDEEKSDRRRNVPGGNVLPDEHQAL